MLVVYAVLFLPLRHELTWAMKEEGIMHLLFSNVSVGTRWKVSVHALLIPGLQSPQIFNLNYYVYIYISTSSQIDSG